MGPGKTTSVQTGAIWGFPKIRGTFLGVSIIRIKKLYYLGVLCWGPPILGNDHMGVPRYFEGGQVLYCFWFGFAFFDSVPLSVSLSLSLMHTLMGVTRLAITTPWQSYSAKLLEPQGELA